MAALETAAEIDVAIAAPAQRRGLGLVFWTAVCWIGLVFVLTISANLLPLADPDKQAQHRNRLGSACPPSGEQGKHTGVAVEPVAGDLTIGKEADQRKIAQRLPN